MDKIKINNYNLVKQYININKKTIINIIIQFFEYNKLKINYIDVNFVLNNRMIKINKKYLNHNYDTDVITFDLSFLPNELTADIYINVDMLIYNSFNLKQNINKELIRLIIHCCLHLIGENDKTENQKQRMNKLEDKFINKFYL